MTTCRRGSGHIAPAAKDLELIAHSDYFVGALHPAPAASSSDPWLLLGVKRPLETQAVIIQKRGVSSVAQAIPYCAEIVTHVCNAGVSLLRRTCSHLGRRWACLITHGRMQHAMKQRVGAQAPSPRA